MYVGVIRGDLPGPLFLADVEPTSQINFPVDPKGQTAYLAYPNPTVLTNLMAGLSPDGQHAEPGTGVAAGIQGSAIVAFPLTLTGSNNVLSIQYVSAGPFTAYTIPAGTYATMASLVAAVNKVLSGAGAKATATTDVATGTFFVLQSTAVGVGAFIEVNTTGVSTFSTAVHFTSNQTFTVPTAAATITALLPVGGPLNVSTAHVLATLGASPSAQSVVVVIAPHFVESEVAIQSYQVGNMSRLLEANFTPDGNRLPALAKSAAITVVEDDGVTVFSSSASAPLPTITAAAHNSPNTGDITITGTGLGNSEFFNATKVTVTGASGASVHLDQKLIAHTVSGGTTGSVSATSIVIPASLLAGLGVAGSTVKLKYVSLPNCLHGAAASITTAINGVSTLTGLTGMTAASVGSFIKLTGAANSTNNGQFLVLAFHSATSVDVGIFHGVGADANNGSIAWVNTPVSFTVT